MSLIEMPRGMFRHSLQWEAANYARAMELNDMLDACSDTYAGRKLYESFTPEEWSGVLPEHARRTINKIAPVGSLVCSVSSEGINVWLGGLGEKYLHPFTTYHGNATVIGQPTHGSAERVLMLHGPCLIDEKQRTFVCCSAYQLKVIK